MPHDLNFRIVLETPPTDVDYALQIGKGPNYETAQIQEGNGTDLRFEFTAGIVGEKPAEPDFRGPVVQGPKGGRFVYIDIGSYAGRHHSHWNRRLKVPLSGMTWAEVDRAIKGKVALECRVPGTGKDGGPNCATVKPFSGWKIAR